MFIGRKNELLQLNRLYNSGKFEFAVIYGRRRVGKTAIINEFVKDKNAICFTGVETNAKQNLENLSECILEFSTGMKVKLKVLVAISHNAKLLLLDEPTAGLDVIARDELLEMLREFLEKDEERSILISSHISSDLESLCDDLYMIHDGKIILHEDTDVLLSDYALLKVDAEQYSKLDKQFILRSKKETYGYSCLTNQKQYYMENYPKIAIEKGTIDEVITMMIRGTEQ